MESEARTLRELFEQRATVSQDDFGKTYGLGSASMVWQYLAGRRPLNLPAACKFARGLGVDLGTISPRLDRLVEEANELRSRSPQLRATAAQDFAHIARVRLAVRPRHAGFKATQEPTATYIAFRRDWLAERSLAPENLLAIACPDEGMQPTLERGDLVVLNVADRLARDGDAFAVNYEGTVLVRRLHRDDARWWLSCDHPDQRRFPRKHFNEKHCFILASAVYRQSNRV